MSLEQKVQELEGRVAALERRPLAGRRPIRLEEATKWLDKVVGKKAVPVAEVLVKGEAEGFSQVLVRRAKRRLGLVSLRKTWKRPSTNG